MIVGLSVYAIAVIAWTLTAITVRKRDEIIATWIGAYFWSLVLIVTAIAGIFIGFLVLASAPSVGDWLLTIFGARG
jgi:hypothetical protein